MFKKRGYLLVALACLVLFLPSSSCQWIKLAAYRITYKPDLELRLEKAPRLNEPVKLTCIRRTEARDAGNHEKIELNIHRLDLKTYSVTDVLLEKVLVGTSLNWEGDMTGEPMEFSATIKFPYEGCWSISARSTYNPRDMDSVVVQVTENESMFGCQKDYRPSGSRSFPTAPSQGWPLAVDLDIPKPPPLDEPVQLTWALNSFRDIDGVISEVQFYRMEGADWVRMPAEDILLEGDLTWEGSLKKDNPLNFSATVKFPQEGDWGISAIADSYAESTPINASSGLYLHIEKDKSRWGWAESHEKPFDGPPAPPEDPG